MKQFTKKSAMRLALIWGMVLISIVLIAVAVRIINGDTDYTGLALIIGACTTFIGALVTGKYWQKKIETKNN